MTLSCKEVTATMAQELEQPIYVKPNRGDAYEFDSGEWKTVSGEFRMFFHIILLISAPGEVQGIGSDDL